MKNLLISIFIIWTVFLYGCSNSEFKLTEEKNIDYSSYQKLLDETVKSSGVYCTYSMYDINNDGIRELILKTGNGELNYVYYFYTLDQSLKPKKIGALSARHSVLYGNEKEPGLIMVTGSRGMQNVSTIKATNENIKKEVFLEGSIGDGNYYKNSLPLSVCYITDKTLTEKNAKLTGQNLKINEAEFAPKNDVQSFSTIPLEMNNIGMDFNLFCKKSNSIVSQVHQDNIIDAHIVLKPNQKLYWFSSLGRHYTIVENNIIVGYIVYNHHLTAGDLFPSDDFYSIMPKQFYSEQSYYTYCCWKILNSYIILGTYKLPNTNADEYYKWNCPLFVAIKDISQFKHYKELK